MKKLFCVSLDPDVVKRVKEKTNLKFSALIEKLLLDWIRENEHGSYIPWLERKIFNVEENEFSRSR